MAQQSNSETLEACDESYAISAGSGSVIIAQESATYRPAEPPVFGEPPFWDRLRLRLPPVLPATRVVEIPDGIVVGNASWVVTPDLKVVVPLSWYESIESKPSLSQVTWSKLHQISGNVLNLGTISGWNNYAHFLLDGVGRISVLEITGKRLSDFDWIVLPGFSSPSSNRLLETLGIPKEKVIRISRNEALSCENLFTPSLAGTSRIYRPCLPTFFRGKVSTSGSGRKIFIARNEARRPISNIENVEKFLVNQGFEIINPTEVYLPKVLAEAEVIVSAHGAAMADIAFANAGTKVIELIPSDHVFPYYYSLAVAADHDYRAVIGASEQVRALDEHGPSPYSFAIDINDLAMSLSK